MKARGAKSGQEGYVLLALMLVLTLMLIAMAVEAPRIAQQIKREKEEELVHRGKDYATAVKRFVHKNGGRYPVSIEQLEDTNHVRFLRKKYKDPITGEADWKMVHVGEAQINIPAQKLNVPSNDNKNPGVDNKNPPPPPPPNSLLANGPPIGGGQIMGVASVSKGTAIKEFNDKDHYDEWYFVYDLRLEQSGGTGVTVAAPRIGGSGAPGSTGQGQGQSQGQQQPGGTPTPVGTPTPAPSPIPN